MFDKNQIVVFLLIVFSSLKAQFGDSFPILKFDIDTVDFGIVNEGDTVYYDFWFTNVGNKDLIIRQAYPACGCTYPTYTNGAVKPGHRGSIHVEFHSSGFGGKEIVKEVIVLLVNGPENYARFKASIVNLTFQKDLEEFKKNAEINSNTKKKRRKLKKKKTN